MSKGEHRTGTTMRITGSIGVVVIVAGMVTLAWPLEQASGQTAKVAEQKADQALNATEEAKKMVGDLQNLVEGAKLTAAQAAEAAAAAQADASAAKSALEAANNAIKNVTANVQTNKEKIDETANVQAMLKGNQLITSGLTGGVAYALHVPLKGIGEAHLDNAASGPVTYLAVLPAYWRMPQAQRAYCASSWTVGDEHESSMKASAIARQTATLCANVAETVTGRNLV